MKPWGLSQDCGKGLVICYSWSSFYTDGILEITRNIKGSAKLHAFQKNPVKGKGIKGINVQMPVLNYVCVFSKDTGTSRFTIIHKKILFRDHVQTCLPPTLPPVSRLFSPVTSVPFLMWVTVLFYSFRDENLQMCTVNCELSNFISVCSGTICKLTVDSK